MSEKYIDYNDYVMLGGTLEVAEFQRACAKACAELDYHTFGRLRGVMNTSDAVKMCMVELIDVCAYANVQYGNGQSGPMVSSTNDGVSVTYGAPNMLDWNAKIYPQRVRAIINTYLANERTEDGTPLLYRGCSR